MVFSASSQVIIVTPILPEIAEALEVGEFLQSLLVGAYAITLSVFALITGPISDKIGRRQILLIGTSSMAVALALHGVAESYILLVTMRALAGCAGGMLSGAAVAYVGDYFPYEQRGWANGWIMSGIAAGQVLGIPLGKVLADLMSYRTPFVLFAVTMGIAALLVWRFVPQPDVELDEERLSVRRAAVNYMDLLRQPGPAASVGAYFLMFFGVGLFVIFLPTWLENDVGVSSMQIAILFAIGGVANVVAGPPAGQISDKIGRKPLIVGSCLVLSVIMMATTYLVVDFFWAAVLFALAMVMVAVRISPLQSLMTALVPDHRRGILMSLAVAIGQVGIGIGSFIAGITFAEYGYFSNTIIGGLSVVLMAVLVQVVLPEPEMQVKDISTDGSDETDADDPGSPSVAGARPPS